MLYVCLPMAEKPGSIQSHLHPLVIPWPPAACRRPGRSGGVTVVAVKGNSDADSHPCITDPETKRKLPRVGSNHEPPD
jgi:hypothetical protein